MPNQTCTVKCPSGLAALTLSLLITAEGHKSLWYVGDSGPVVLTTAPLDVVLACARSASNPGRA